MAHDWALIQREYIQGYQDKDGKTICPTLEELCQRHGCSISTIKKKSASQNWNQQRNLYGTKRNQKILEKKEELMIEESTTLDNKALTAANKGIEIGLERLKDKNLSNPDYLKISNAISNFHKMGKLALGEETEHTKTTGKNQFEVNIHDRIHEYEKRFTTINTASEGSDSSDNI